jgi:hypothetical protein
MFLSRPEPVTVAVCDDVHLDPVTKRKSQLGVARLLFLRRRCLSAWR